MEQDGAERWCSSSNAVVVYEDGTTADYIDSQKGHLEEIIDNGPRSIEVLKFKDGAGFEKVRLLPRKRR